MSKKEVKVTATLLNWKCVLDGHKHIVAKFMFDMTKTSVNQLYGMRGYYVALEEPDRGVKRKPLGEFTGKMGEITLPPFPKKEGKFVVVFPDADMVCDALRQIGECEPATVFLIQSDLELEFDSNEPAEDSQQSLAVD